MEENTVSTGLFSKSGVCLNVNFWLVVYGLTLGDPTGTQPDPSSNVYDALELIHHHFNASLMHQTFIFQKVWLITGKASETSKQTKVTRTTKVTEVTKVIKVPKVTKVTKVSEVTKVAKVPKVPKVTKVAKVANTRTN